MSQFTVTGILSLKNESFFDYFIEEHCSWLVCNVGAPDTAVLSARLAQSKFLVKENKVTKKWAIELNVELGIHWFKMNCEILNNKGKKEGKSEEKAVNKIFSIRSFFDSKNYEFLFSNSIWRILWREKDGFSGWILKVSLGDLHLIHLRQNVICWNWMFVGRITAWRHMSARHRSWRVGRNGRCSRSELRDERLRARPSTCKLSALPIVGSVEFSAHRS